MTALRYSPGTLVRARGREWIVLAGSDTEILRVRPILGSEEDQTLIHLGLELEPVTEASFPKPEPHQKAGHEASLLLRDALLLSLRRGAGPFRSFGQIAVAPRAYQLVPLLMALKLDPVRLLIADDVGIGKSVEAGLIARELLDRGEVSRFTVLCPPHLVEQWLAELEKHFHLRAAAVTSTSAARLERGLPPSESIFSAHPYTVVSLDYIKNEKRRSDFLRACPELVIVDEAHTCAAAGSGRHQRHELLRALSESPQRHMVLLTATPHSGDEAAFYRLLSLLDRSFENLASATGEEREKLRAKLALHFVQRRRIDIDEWQDGSIFPHRKTNEKTYRLTGNWERFFNAVLDYCADVVEAAEGDQRRQRLNFWGTLALMRCVASSPAAAVQALRTRAGQNIETNEEELSDRVFDGGTDSLLEDDVEPPIGSDDPKLASLIAQAEQLAGQTEDPKLKLLTEQLATLLADGFNPVIFCRYIATAHYLGKHLRTKYKNVTMSVVTGELAAEERQEKIELLGEAEQRILIATDCLSEGINLQDHFDSVLHYDLSWNPTRHEQREGRVDRFGQPRPIVRTTLIYGANNPVDGAVLKIIIRKADKIREELGVPVPLPDDGHTLSQALLKAVLLRRVNREPETQSSFEFMDIPAAQELDTQWQDIKEKTKKNRTIFAQRRMKPTEVLPEWNKTISAVGGHEEVKRFASRGLARLGAALEPLPRGFKAPLDALPEDVKERLAAEGLSGTVRIDFAYPPAPRCHTVQRSHPLISVLAETLLERTLSSNVMATTADPGVLGRVGCWISNSVTDRTIVALLRLRHQLMIQKHNHSTMLLVEEATALAWVGTSTLLEGLEAMSLLAPPPVGDPPLAVWERTIKKASEFLEERLPERNAFAEKRAQVLLSDHRRVRDAARDHGSYTVKALLPADLVGLVVLLPRMN